MVAAIGSDLVDDTVESKDMATTDSPSPHSPAVHSLGISVYARPRSSGDANPRKQRPRHLIGRYMSVRDDEDDEAIMKMLGSPKAAKHASIPGGQPATPVSPSGAASKRATPAMVSRSLQDRIVATSVQRSSPHSSIIVTGSGTTASVKPLASRHPSFIIPFFNNLDLRSMKNLRDYFKLSAVNEGESPTVRGMHLLIRGSVKVRMTVNGNVEQVIYERQNGDWFSDTPHLHAATSNQYEWREVRAVATQSSFILSCPADQYELFCIRYTSARCCASLVQPTITTAATGSATTTALIGRSSTSSTASGLINPHASQIRRVTAPFAPTFSATQPLPRPVTLLTHGTSNSNSLFAPIAASTSSKSLPKKKHSPLLLYDEWTLPLHTVACLTGIPELQLLHLHTLFQSYYVNEDEVIFRENDEASGLFIIVSGRVHVSVSNTTNSVHLDTLTARHVFGELSCVLNVPRSTTVKAVQRTHLLYLSPSSFQILLKLFPHIHSPASPLAALINHRIGQSLKCLPFFNFLRTKQVGPLKQFDNGRLGQLATFFTFVHYKTQQTIFQQGENSDGLYLLWSGSVSVRARPRTTKGAVSDELSGDGTVLLATLGKYEWFGELGLMFAIRRTATVVANEPTVVLKLKAEHFGKFVSLVPDCQPMLKRVTAMRITSELSRIPLIQSMRENRPFSKLDVLASMFVYKEFAPSSVLVSEGVRPPQGAESKAEPEPESELASESESKRPLRFYMLLSGRVEILKRYTNVGESGASSVLLETLEPNAWFGELSLRSQCSFVTIRACTDSPVLTLSISATEFHQCLSIAPDLNQLFNQLYTTRLATIFGAIPFFKQCIRENKPWSKCELFASMVKMESYERGAAIVARDKFAIVIVGSVLQSTSVRTGQPIVLHTGHWFGERTVLRMDTSAPASTVAATADDDSTASASEEFRLEARSDCVLFTLTHAQLASFLKLAPEVKEALLGINGDIAANIAAQPQTSSASGGPKPRSPKWPVRPLLVSPSSPSSHIVSHTNGIVSNDPVSPFVPSSPSMTLLANHSTGMTRNSQVQVNGSRLPPLTPLTPLTRSYTNSHTESLNQQQQQQQQLLHQLHYSALIGGIDSPSASTMASPEEPLIKLPSFKDSVMLPSSLVHSYHQAPLVPPPVSAPPQHQHTASLSQSLSLVAQHSRTSTLTNAPQTQSPALVDTTGQ